MTEGAILTKDFRIREAEETESSNRLALVANLDLGDSQLTNLVKDIIQGQRDMLIQFIGRSGHSRIGLDINSIDLKSAEFKGNKMEARLEAVYLANCFRERFISNLKNIGPVENPEIGRLFVSPKKIYDSEVASNEKQSHLPKSRVEKLIREKRLALGENSKILEDGTIEIPLEKFLKLVDTEYLNSSDIIRKILIGGKHETKRIQYESVSGLPEKINPDEFMVGGIKISTLTHIALIDKVLGLKQDEWEKTKDSNIYHLSARILDPMRTTGLKIPREVEIYNPENSHINTRNLRIRIKLFDPSLEKQKRSNMLWRKLVENNQIRRSHETGVGFKDITDIENPKIFEELFRHLSDKHAIILAQNRMGYVPKKTQEITGETSEAEMKKIQGIDRQRQNDLSVFIAERIIDEDENYSIKSDSAPLFLKSFSSKLDSIGGNQHLGKVFVSENLPDVSTAEALVNKGIGVFIAKNVQDGEPYFDAQKYETLLKLTKEKGLRFFVLIGEEEDKKLYEHYKGFWVRTDKKETFDKVSTFLAIFGTHKKELNDILEPEIYNFFEKIIESGIFGEKAEKLGIFQGKGPGLMQLADTAAFVRGLTSVGVGIDARNDGQETNTNPLFQLDFLGSSGGKRQEIMDQLSVFKIYNIGGYGTMEEFAMARKNTKLSYLFIGPHIYVDPRLKEDQAREHLWEKTKLQNERIAQEGLGEKWVNENSHYVGSYDEALEIMKEFVSNPETYWEKCGIPENAIKISLKNGIEIFRKFGIQVPKFLIPSIKKRAIDFEE